MRNRFLAVLLAGTATFTASAATAQEAPASSSTAAQDNGEIIVTARKRAESVQDIPATINVFTDEALARSGIVDSRDLAAVTPSLNISPAIRETNVSMRGIVNNVRSLGADPSIAVSLNGIYLPRSNMALTELFDVERVEVLKGPQGDLYGRNATGGAINFITKAPSSTPEFSGFVGAGSNDLFRAQAAASVGSETFSLRVAGAYAKDSGYTKELLTGQKLDAVDFRAVRVTARFAPSSAFEATMFWQHTEDDSNIGFAQTNDPQYSNSLADFGYNAVANAYAPNLLRVDAHHVRLDAKTFAHRKSEIVGLNMSLDLGAATLRSITGFTDYRYVDQFDNDGTGAPIEVLSETQNVQSISQEFQLVGKGSDHFEWLLGGFLYWDKGNEGIFDDFNVAIPAGVNFVRTISILSRAKSSAQAVFGQATYHFSKNWSLTVGARYSHDYKSGVSTYNGRTNVNNSVSFNKFTPSAKIQWTPNSDTLVYAGVSTGYKSGGLNFLDTSGFPIFGEEKITSYEAGFKTELLDRKLTLNGAVFHYDYRGIQLRTNFLSGNPPTNNIAVTNAASAKISGAEMQVIARLNSVLSFDANVAYVDSSISNFRSPATGQLLNGRPLPQAPKWSGSVGATVETGIGSLGALRGRLEYNFRSSVLFPVSYDADLISDGSLGLVNATLRWTEPRKRFYVEAIGRNLGNVTYRVFRADYSPYLVPDAFGAGRTFEVRLGVNF